MEDRATPQADAVARRCLRWWCLFAGLVACATFLMRTWPDALGTVLAPIDLGQETNVAVWFSASSLIWSGLLMWSAGATIGGRDRWAATAIVFLGVLSISLSVDEAGSLHERFDLLFPAFLGLSLKKVAALLALPVLVSVGILFSRRSTLGQSWALILGAYFLFGSVYLQEILEHALDWPAGLLPLRAVVEEGTELVGFFLLLLAAVRLVKRSWQAYGGGQGAQSIRFVLPTRATLQVGFLLSTLAAPLMILWALSVPDGALELFHRGDFGSTMMVAMFLIAGMLCLREAATHPSPRAWVSVALVCFLLSLLQNWHAYTDASVIFAGREPARLWRAAFDLVWALPILILVTLCVYRQTGMALWMLVVFVLLWCASVVAMQRATYRLSYAASFLSALVIGAWVLYATCHGCGKTAESDTPATVEPIWRRLWPRR